MEKDNLLFSYLEEETNNLYNTLIPEDLDSIKVTSEGDLFISDWNYMEKFNNKFEKAQYFNHLRKMFNLILY